VSKVASLPEEAEEDILAFYAFPADHWRKLRLDQPAGALQPRNRPAHDVVGIFPDDPSMIRLATMLAIEQNDEWLVGRRYLSTPHQGGDPRAPTGLSSQPHHRRDERPALTPRLTFDHPAAASATRPSRRSNVAATTPLTCTSNAAQVLACAMSAPP
jgi:Transposase, Mutator family